MPQEHKKHNRTVCTFCPNRDTCNALYGAIHCGDCKYTIPCTQKEGPGLLDCGRAKEAWEQASLPCKCMLATLMLANPPEGLHIKMPGCDDGEEEAAELMPCPRCGCQTAVIITSYEWVPDQKTKTQRKITCGVCALDVQETFE